MNWPFSRVLFLLFLISLSATEARRTSGSSRNHGSGRSYGSSWGHRSSGGGHHGGSPSLGKISSGGLLNAERGGRPPPPRPTSRPVVNYPRPTPRFGGSYPVTNRPWGGQSVSTPPRIPTPAVTFRPPHPVKPPVSVSESMAKKESAPSQHGQTGPRVPRPGGGNSTSSYPDWANPHYPHPTASHNKPHLGNNSTRIVTTPLGNPISPHPGYPYPHPNPQNLPIPGHPHTGPPFPLNPGYPHSNTPYPLNPAHPHPNAPYHTNVGHPHPQNYPPPPPPSPIYGGPYGGSLPIQSQHPLSHVGQPAPMPFTPSQPVVIVNNNNNNQQPGQPVFVGGGGSSSGGGIGDTIMHSLISASIYAGVNRLVNPPHYHHVQESNSATGTRNTHTTINNYYGDSGPNGNSQGQATAGIGAGAGSTPAQSGPASNRDAQGSNPSPAISASSPTNSPSGPANPPSSPTIPTSGPSTPVAGSTGSVGSSAGPVQNVGPRENTNVGNSNFGANSSLTNNSNNSTNPGDNATGLEGPVYKVSTEQLFNITEEIFAKNEYDPGKFITLNLQRSARNQENLTDLASEPLLFVQQEAYEIPTIQAIRTLYDNYEFDSRVKEISSEEKRREEKAVIHQLLNTHVMSAAMTWLANNGFIDPDDFEREDTLRRIWFTKFQGSSSGFERVFMAEMVDAAYILGVQDWIYFDHKESTKNINYMGFVDKISIGNSASLLKLNYEMNGLQTRNTTIFVGTTPELEMSLYTICFYARPNDLCPVSLGGTKFYLYAHSFRYFGTDIIDLALPMI